MRELNNIFMLRYIGYLILAVIVLSTAPFTASSVRAQTSEHAMLVYKTPTCGCCTTWVNHMKEAGFITQVKNMNNLNLIKKRLNIAPKDQACHSAVWQGFVFEGHIPANVIEHFMKSKPSAATGLAVPGMPMGSPGMDTGRVFAPYVVYQLNKDGSRAPYATVSMNKTQYVEKNYE